jgi:hypothetical protein
MLNPSEDVEVKVLIPPTLEITPSILLVTVSSIVSGLAPLYEVKTTTMGRLISGNNSTARLGRTTRASAVNRI